jgi:hypothetical protein
MLITESMLSFSFDRNIKIRRDILDVEDLLTGFMALPLQIIAVPEDAPGEIPRAIGNSKGGHSNLVISQNNCNFNTVYDGNFPSEWGLCREYLREKIVNLFPAVVKLSHSEILSVGLVVKIVSETKVNESVESIMNQILGITKVQNSISDISAKLTFDRDEKYYINFIIESIKKLKINPIPGKPGIIYAEMEPISEGIQFTIDVNDKRAANFSAQYLSSQDDANSVLDILSEIMENKISRVIEYGDWRQMEHADNL